MGHDGVVGNSYSMRGYYEGAISDKHKSRGAGGTASAVWKRNGVVVG